MPITGTSPGKAHQTDCHTLVVSSLLGLTVLAAPETGLDREGNQQKQKEGLMGRKKEEGLRTRREKHTGRRR